MIKRISRLLDRCERSNIAALEQATQGGDVAGIEREAADYFRDTSHLEWGSAGTARPGGEGL